MSESNPAEWPTPAAAPRRSTGGHTGAREATDADFSSFYSDTVRHLVAFLLNQGATLPVATDIAQDTMIKLYQRWTEIARPRAWVHTVASRALVRRIAETREEPLDPLPEATALLPRPQDAADWEARHDLLRVLEILPPRQRQILAWTFSSYTPTEIAEQLGMSPNAVSASLAKARRAAVEYLTTTGYIDPGEEEQ
ncbi:sigma-70 family RNA polymerase sigma factor [Nonomuraea wenchangensis]